MTNDIRVPFTEMTSAFKRESLKPATKEGKEHDEEVGGGSVKNDADDDVLFSRDYATKPTKSMPGWIIYEVLSAAKTVVKQFVNAPRTKAIVDSFVVLYPHQIAHNKNGGFGGIVKLTAGDSGVLAPLNVKKDHWRSTPERSPGSRSAKARGRLRALTTAPYGLSGTRSST
eukprot:PhM_4_TR15886/c4_g1_i2/m.17027